MKTIVKMLTLFCFINVNIYANTVNKSAETAKKTTVISQKKDTRKVKIESTYIDPNKEDFPDLEERRPLVATGTEIKVKIEKPKEETKTTNEVLKNFFGY